MIYNTDSYDYYMRKCSNGVYISQWSKGDSNTETIINNPNEEGVGEIYVRTDQIMNGYYRDPDKTGESFDGAYFKTGDLGRIDDKGYLYITGRIKESILMPNGAKVAPADMENLLIISEKHAVIACPMPWNEDITEQGIVRAKDWAEIYDLVNGGPESLK